MNIEYVTISQYIQSKSTILDKIKAYDTLILAMESSILTGIESSHLIQYELDDGQMKVRAQYRNISDMTNAMVGLEKLRQMYINRYNGRGIRLVGGGL